VKPSRLGRWIACLSVAWLLVPVGSAHAERPDVFWMRGGHAHSIMAVQYSADGSMVASGGNDGTIKLWRAADGMLLRTLTGHQVPNPQLLATVQSVAFSPDGTLLASAGNDGTIFVWRVADGTVAQTLSAFIAGQNGCLSPCGLAFSPNGQMLGLGTAAGLQMGLRIWRVADWTVLFESSSYGAFSFSPDPSTPDRVAAMTSNGFKIIQIPSGAVLLSVTTGAPAGPTFSPDAQLIVAGAVYNALDGSLVSSPGASSFVFGGFAFSPDGQTLAFSGLEHDPAPAMTYHSVIKLFRRADLVNPSPAPIAVWSPHGGGQAVIAFSPDSQTLVSAGAIYQFQSNYILGLRLWSVPDGALVGLLAAYTNFVWKVALSPDGTTVTAASELTTGQTDPLGLNALRLWNAQTGDLTLTIPDLGQTGVAFSLDGQTLVSASACCTSTLAARSVVDGSFLAIPGGNPIPGKQSLAFLADGQTVAGYPANNDNSIQLWNLGDGSVTLLTQPATGSRFFAISSDRTRLAAVIGDGKQVQIWDMINRTPVTTLQYGQFVTALAFSPDATIVAAGIKPSLTSGAGTSIVSLRVADGTMVGSPLIGHTNNIVTLAFSPDGNALASSGDDSTIRFWSTVDGTVLKILDQETGSMPGRTLQGVRSLIFSPDGGMIIYGRADATLVVARNPLLPGIFTLTVSRAGAGTGTVTSSPAGIACGSSCAAELGEGTAVTLTAIPAAGSYFAGWSGNPACATGAFTMLADYACTAVFNLRQSQAITLDPLSDKSVTDPPFMVSATASSGLPVSFGATGGCAVSGATVTLTAAGTCTITASQPGNAIYEAAPDVARSFTVRQTQTITFGSLPDRVLTDPPFTVSATASSGLSVSFIAAGGCTVSGTTVTLTAVGTCTITASQTGNASYDPAPNVARSFNVAQPSYALTVALAGVGTGSVVSSPTGISCPTTCATAFVSGTVVTLTATPGAGSLFMGWSGGCTTSPCSVTMSAAQSVTATFAPNAPDLIETSVSDPLIAALPGASFSVTDTVLNQGGVSAATSTTRYYLSTDTVKDASDRLLSGTRAVPVLAAGAMSTGTVTVTIPSNMALGSYYLIACADNLTHVTESDETNNCRASTGTVQVARPDLLETDLSAPPATIARGASFAVTDTVLNQGAVAAGASTTRFYLSADQIKDGNDRLLTGTRAVPALAAGATSSGTVSVTVPSNMVLGTYYLIACADNTTTVTESDETNNCRASDTTVQVTMP